MNISHLIMTAYAIYRTPDFLIISFFLFFHPTVLYTTTLSPHTDGDSKVAWIVQCKIYHGFLCKLWIDLLSWSTEKLWSHYSSTIVSTALIPIHSAHWTLTTRHEKCSIRLTRVIELTLLTDYKYLCIHECVIICVMCMIMYIDTIITIKGFFFQ